MTSNALQLSGVSAWYGTAQALHDVSLDVREGEMVGLLGRNGAGKSTTFKTILGIEVKRRGQIAFNGEELINRSPEQVARSGVGWVPPDRRIFVDLSVQENLRLSAVAGGVDLKVDDLVGALPLLKPLLGRRGFQLSGGEQQVVAIARALAARPRVVLLDEPTEGLAPVVVDQLKTAIARLPERFGVSVILAEQNLQFVLDLVSRVHVLETGRTAYQGTADEFRASPELQHRYLSVSGEYAPANRTTAVVESVKPDSF